MLDSEVSTALDIILCKERGANGMALTIHTALPKPYRRSKFAGRYGTTTCKNDFID